MLHHWTLMVMPRSDSILRLTPTAERYFGRFDSTGRRSGSVGAYGKTWFPLAPFVRGRSIGSAQNFQV